MVYCELRNKVPNCSERDPPERDPWCIVSCTMKCLTVLSELRNKVPSNESHTDRFDVFVCLFRLPPNIWHRIQAPGTASAFLFKV